MSAAMTTGTRTWLKRAGILGFGFFLAKGLLWIAAGVFFYVFV